jgi:phenylpropionate dioxygenase-like ring-hydroxylating dioxygenase large terminal subunit
VGVPYAKRIPPNSNLSRWPVLERNGLVLIWHHARGTAPQWEIPELEEHRHEDWTDYCRLRWKIRTHNQELAEHAVDRAHFRFVHGTLDVPESRVELDGPVLRVRQRAMMPSSRGPVEGLVESQSHGFGFVVTRFAGTVETLLIASVLPIDEHDVEVRFSFTLKKPGDAALTRSVHRALVAEIEKKMNENKPIWENKRYLARPLLCDGDGPIAQFRRWSEQFYSWPADHAPSVAAR